MAEKKGEKKFSIITDEIKNYDCIKNFPGEISEKIENEIPENNILEIMDNLFYKLGKIVSEKNTLSETKRSLADRASIKNKKDDPNYEQQRDKISEDFLDQREIDIDGSKARYVYLDGTGFKKDENKAKIILKQNPIVIIPGLSNDLASVENMSKELALQGREVIVIAYPDSALGTVSKEFLEKMKETDGFEAHADFFETAILRILGEDAEFEILAHSTGCPISAELLNREEFSKRVTAATLLSPAAVSDELSMPKMVVGALNEIIKSIERKELKKYSFITYKDTKTEEDKIKTEARKILLRKIIDETSEKWKGMKIANNGTINVYSGNRDKVTKSSSEDAITRLLENPNINIIKDPEGSHTTALTALNRVLRMIEESKYDPRTEKEY
jgi:hypothetical protein